MSTADRNRQRAVRQLDLVLLLVVFIAGAMLGGSSLQGLDGHLWLQGICALVLFLTIAPGRPKPLNLASLLALAISAAWCLYGLLQLMPLPAGWLDTPGHDVVLRVREALGLPVDAVAISLAPGETVSTLLAVLPPLATFVLLSTASWQLTLRPACWAIAGLAAASTLLGLAQLLTGPDTPLYLHDSAALSLGFFSNPNHQATFIIMALPIALVLLVDQRRQVQGGDAEIGLLIAAAGLFLSIVVGVVTAGSGAGYVLLVATIPLCGLLLIAPQDRRPPAWVLAVFFLAAGLGIAASLASPFFPPLGWAVQDGDNARPAMWRTGFEIAKDHLPFGTGLGAFEFAFPLYEDQAGLTGKYVNAAHNEYLQILVEGGLPGAGLLLAAMALWVWLTARAWTSDGPDSRMRRAASVATLVAILHSLIDYPLQAPVYAIVAASAFALLAAPDPSPRNRPAGSEPRSPYPD